MPQEKEGIRRVFGNDFLDTLSNNAASSPLHAVEELVANSWDADARRVNVILEPDRLIIEDDGTGMAPNEIQDFYRVGDSKKVGKKSPGGREYFGSFGLATLSIRSLAGKYTLETISNGDRTVVSEKFPTKLSLEDVLVPQVFKSNGEKQGTKLRLEELKVSEKNGFTTEKLTNHLAWAMPIDDPDFVLTVNGIKVVPKAIETAHKFEFHYVGEKLGESSGFIYLTKHPIKEAGIYVTVNKRRIGNPKEIINLHELNDSTARRVIARISADGLRKYIRSDRGGFLSSEAFDEFRKGLVEHLKEVGRFDEHRSQTKKSITLTGLKDHMVKDILAKLKRANIEEVVGGARIKFSEELPAHIASKFDTTQNKILINPNYPTTSTEVVQKAALLKQGILLSSVDALSEHRANQGQGNITELQKFRLMILNELATTSISKEHAAIIFPSLHYPMAALAEISGQSLTTVRYLGENHALKVQLEEVLGRSYLELSEKTKGLVPLPEFISRKVLTTGMNLYQQIQRFKEIFDTMGRNAFPFIQRWKDSSAYFVESSCDTGLAKELKEIHLKTSPVKIAQTLKQYGNRFLSPTELGQETRLKPEEASRVIEYAQGQKIEIEYEGKVARRYKFSDFVSALQQRRGNPVDLSKLV